MQFPEEWDSKQRSSASSMCATTRGSRSITNADISAFATEASYKKVEISTQFAKSLSSDFSNIESRILELLPRPSATDATAAKAATAGGGRKKRTHRNMENDSDDDDDTTPGSPIACGSSSMVPRSNMRLELDTLLSRLAYKRLMQEMLPYNPQKPLPSVPLITRVYEEMYMREPMNANERQCAHGEQCECMFIDPNNKFVAVEFLVPSEDPGPTPKSCVLCSRAITQQLFYDIVFDNISFNALIQRFGNLHSTPNEYAKDAMLICPPHGPIHAMPLPIMSHQRNRYTVSKIGGVRFIRQNGVYFQ
jgi:hypothetical protein